MCSNGAFECRAFRAAPQQQQIHMQFCHIRQCALLCHIFRCTLHMRMRETRAISLRGSVSVSLCLSLVRSSWSWSWSLREYLLQVACSRGALPIRVRAQMHRMRASVERDGAFRFIAAVPVCMNVHSTCSPASGAQLHVVYYMYVYVG